MGGINNKKSEVEMELVTRIIEVGIIVVCVIGVGILIAKYGFGIDTINKLFRLR